jgi:phosphatidylserine decarboxylase
LLKWLFKIFVELTGNRFMSRLLIRVTTSKWSRIFIPLFVKVYHINQAEMKLPLSEYHSLQHLFTRELKSEIRAIDNHKHVIVSPVDGVVSAFGSVSEVEKYKVKNRQLNLEEMLGSEEIAATYKKGKYIILYLSPHHYHRIHSPVKGRITNSWTLGGKSYPVNSLGIKYGNKPLSTNRRTVTEIESELQNIAVVKVGALNVNSIHLTNQSKELEPGDELAYFSFGSTVILLMENEHLQFATNVTVGEEIKYGERLLFLN